MNFERIKADNRIFRALSQQDWAAWLPHLEPMAWHEGAILADTSQPVSHVCFPTQGVVSLQAVASPAVSLARVGREGVIGLMPPADGASKPCQAVAETAGEGCRIALSQVQAAMETSSEVMLVLLRYQHALTAQITQAALCRHHHTLEQQFCRWLLLGVDWLDGAERVVSCHVESEFVGHRMEEVIAVVHRLQAASLIECAWPQITVRDREGLAQRCCDCYATIKREYQIL